eukprot:1144677-Pelagomonas_calceolata.AAC.5
MSEGLVLVLVQDECRADGRRRRPAGLMMGARLVLVQNGRRADDVWRMLGGGVLCWQCSLMRWDGRYAPQRQRRCGVELGVRHKKCSCRMCNRKQPQNRRQWLWRWS